MISGLTVIERNSAIKSAKMNEYIGMMNIDTGKYFVLNDIGAQIWNFAKEPISVDELVVRLTHEFDISYGDCLKSVIPYIENLRKERLINIVSI